MHRRGVRPALGRCRIRRFLSFDPATAEPRGALRTSPSALSALHLTIAVAFLTIAIPLKAHGRWITIGWLVEGAALLWLARRVASRLLRGLAVTALVLGLGALIVIHPAASTTIIFNQRFGTYLVGVLVFAFVARLASGAEGDSEPEFAISWPMTGAIALLIVNVLILVAIGWEIHNYWWFVRYSGDWAVMRDYRMYAQFTYSAFFMMFGAMLLAVGFWRRSAFLRWQALILLAISIGKVFLVDVSQLSQGYRIVSFLGLGALLLAVSFVYQKDWLNLPGFGAASAMNIREARFWLLAIAVADVHHFRYERPVVGTQRGVPDLRSA